MKVQLRSAHPSACLLSNMRNILLALQASPSYSLLIRSYARLLTMPLQPESSPSRTLTETTTAPISILICTTNFMLKRTSFRITACTQFPFLYKTRRKAYILSPFQAYGRALLGLILVIQSWSAHGFVYPMKDWRNWRGNGMPQAALKV